MTDEERAQMAALRKDVDALLREHQDQERLSIKNIQDVEHFRISDGESMGNFRDEKRARDLWHEIGKNHTRYTDGMVRFLQDDIAVLSGRIQEILVSLAEPQIYPPQATAAALLAEIRAAAAAAESRNSERKQWRS